MTGYDATMHPAVVYKIVARDQWRLAEAAGSFAGSSVDRRDGFIHLSTAAQVSETVARHFRGDADLLLVEVAAGVLELRWEPSRGGDLFPHLYTNLPMSAVTRVVPLPLGPDGQHRFPDLGQ
jgi:uncharacterized protein (DUF952 family)